MQICLWRNQIFMASFLSVFMFFFAYVCGRTAVGITELSTAVTAVHPQTAAGFTVHSLKGVMIIFSLFLYVSEHRRYIYHHF